MKLRLIPALVIASALAGCSEPDTPAQILTDARIEMDARDFASARKLLDGLIADSTALTAMDVKQLVTAAELYTTMALTDNNASPESDEASAARCLTAARAIDADSVDTYVNALAVEAANHLRTISSVSAYLECDRDSLLLGEEPDSVE